MPDIWAVATIASKALLYFGVLTSGGLVLTRLVFATELSGISSDLRKFAVACALLAIVAAGVGFALRGAALTGDASGLIDPEMLGLMWQTPVGTALLLRLIGLGLMLVGLIVGGLGWGLACAGALVTLWSFTTIGHMSDGIALWARLILLGHLVAAAFWIGILLPLQRLTRSDGDLPFAGQLGHRFGQMATMVIPALIAAGAVLGWILVGTWTNLFTTSYGLSLIVKLGFVAVVLMLGAWNKMRVVPKLRSGDAHAATDLRRTLRLEWIVFWAVLLATAMLTSLFALPGGH